eukprot:5194969-Amphidinium_carterae.1
MFDVSNNVVASLEDLGSHLCKDEFKEKRMEEIHKLEEMFQCFEVIARSEADQSAKVYGHRWVEAIRHGVPKSRLTLQDFKHKAKLKDDATKSSGAWSNEEIEGVQSPTPSNMLNKLMMWLASFYEYPVVSIDVVSAFPHAAERNEQVLMEPPQEWLDLRGHKKGTVLWRMKGNLYGRRTAPGYFREHLEGLLVAMPDSKFVRGTLEPCLFYSSMLNLRVSHHVDDIRAVGPSSSLKALVDHLKQYLLLKVSPELNAGSLHEYLGRDWGRLKKGWMLFPHRKHIMKVCDELEFGKCGRGMPKPSVTPGVEVKSCTNQDWEPLNAMDVSRFRSMVGSLIFVSLDVPEIAYAVKELARSLSAPCTMDWRALTRLGKFLQNKVEWG